MMPVDTRQQTRMTDPRFLAVRHALEYVGGIVRTWPALGSDALRVVGVLGETMMAGSVVEAEAWPGVWAWVFLRARIHGEGWAASGRKLLEAEPRDARDRQCALRRVVEGEAEAAAGWLARVILGACAGGAGVELARQALDQCVVEAIEAEAAADADRMNEEDGSALARRRALHDVLANRWAETGLGLGWIRC
ncbi:hypothetical protein [Polyangium sp. 6x1]|uniref:hypothetical protein n=1 Tax=Polyangium sp. 6x1 TaxID=3042689 RepID=UPI002482C2E0|nr:hypothetical protein [Polyangium sp. 6x1]MDI1444617.1 hypothetical protein [Polyangium sp. 6x1]